MGYLGQKYDKGLVIQRSPEGSAFQENADVTVDGDTEITPKVSGGFKKVTVYGAGGSEVIPNPEMEGDEPDLTGIEIDGVKYKIPEGTAVEANPTLEGNERPLGSLKIGEAVYDLKGKTYEKNNIHNESSIEHQANRNVATTDIYTGFSNDEGTTSIETEIVAESGYAEKTTTIQLLDDEDNSIASAQISMKAGMDAETGDPYSKIDIKGDDELGAEINIGGELDQVKINGQPYNANANDSTLEFDTVADLYSYLTSNNISYCPIMISDIGAIGRFTKLGVLNSSTSQVIGIEDITDILTYFGNEARIHQKTFNTKSHLCIVVGETMEF